MIQCDHVAYVVQDHRGSLKTILHPISFEAPTSTITLVRGRSGAGKSTLLSMVAGVLRPSQGQVLFQNEPISRFTAAHRDRFRQRVGLVTQRLHLFDELTSIENVLLPLVPRRTDPNFIEHALQLIDTLHLPSNQPVRSLSGGERQRVAIARALVNDPELIVLDEPTAHQDTDHVSTIVELIQSAIDRQGTIIVAAHDERLDKALKASIVIELEDGMMVPR